MKKYKVMVKCWGFKRRMWNVGEVVDLGDTEVPPRHFKLIGGDAGNPAPVPAPVDIMKPTELDLSGKPVKTVGGFAGNIDLVNPEPMETAATAKKKMGRPKKV